MNILYVYAHPNPSSFNGMLKKKALYFLDKIKANVKLSDLYENNFKANADWNDFNLDREKTSQQYFLAQQEAYNKHLLTAQITEELEKLKWADHIFFQFPLWWFSTPAILKGWFDRILVKGFAYDAGKVFKDGLLKGKTASLILSTQSPESTFHKEGANTASIDAFLFPIHHTFSFVGIKSLATFVTYAAFNLSPEQEEKTFKDFFVYLQKIMDDCKK